MLAKATNVTQIKSNGKQTGGRVFCFYTQTTSNAIAKYLNNGVRFVREPVTEPYGRVAVFEDFYGNLLDLIQPSRGG